MGVVFCGLSNCVTGVFSIHSERDEFMGSVFFEDFFYSKVVKPLMYKSTLGRNSIEGLADTGFNFEYMYQNKSSGDGFMGAVIDKIILNLPAVKATRNRKETIKKIIARHIIENRQDNKSTSILDIASGSARYLIELDCIMKNSFRALCLDRDERSLQVGRVLSERFRLEENITYRKADVFDGHALKNALDFDPDVIIVSGLYVYCDDEKVSRSLNMLSTLLRPEGTILVDNQLYNPSRKLMEKVCQTTSGAAWRLRYRSEKEMKALMDPFFNHIRCTTDKWGIYNIAVGTVRETVHSRHLPDKDVSCEHLSVC